MPMKRIGVLISAIAIAFTATASRPIAAPLAKSPARAATFVGLKDGETLFVERVHQVPGGFHGEVSLPGGSVWVRYRVEVAPDESIRRYELDMTPRGAQPGVDPPMPLLVARRTRDSILIEPEPGTRFPGAREAVPAGTFMGSTEMAMFEQAIRFGLSRGGARASFPIVSAWTGKRMVATLIRSDRNQVELETTMDVWRFTLDAQRRIVNGVRVRGREAGGVDPWQGIRVVRLSD
jgi:hypothetical protein